MTTEPLVTVVTPTHNRIEMLAETVASVRAQSFADWEYIVVDDGSDDGTWSWLQAQAAGENRLRALRLDESQERAAARNAGLEAARGRHILFLDDDDQLPPQAIGRHLAALETYPQAIASVGGHLAFDLHGGRRSHRSVRRTRLLHVWEQVLFGWVPVCGQWLFRTGDLRALGGWDGAHIPIEDHVLLLALSRRGPVAVLPDLVLHYRAHPGQWRPADLDERMDRVRREALQTLPETEQAAARRILAARSEYNLGLKYYWEAAGWRAGVHFFRSAARKPSLLQSPVSARMILPPLLKSLSGRYGMRLGGWLRRTGGGRIESSVRVVRQEEE